MTRAQWHGRARRLLLAVALMGLASGPLAAHSMGVRAASLGSATQVMNWFPEPEHGGYEAAEMLGLYKKYGLDVKIVPYSFSMNADAQVALGHITFGMTNADALFNDRVAGLPLVAVMATFQTNPQCFMWHANDKSIKTLADLSNHTIIYTFGGSFWDYMKDKYHYKNIKEVSYNFTLRDFLATPNGVNQCYITSEPYTAQHSGHAVKAALIASTGYDPYGDVMVTTESEIKNHPDVVRAYVAASVAGWKAYYDKANTEKVNAYMRADPTSKDYPLTPAAMTYDEVHSMSLVVGGEAKTHGIGYIDPARMTLLKKQLLGVGIKVAGINPTSIYTDAFLPRK